MSFLCETYRPEMTCCTSWFMLENYKRIASFIVLAAIVDRCCCTAPSAMLNDLWKEISKLGHIMYLLICAEWDLRAEDPVCCGRLCREDDSTPDCQVQHIVWFASHHMVEQNGLA
jgi:hypothetical protein